MMVPGIRMTHGKLTHPRFGRSQLGCCSSGRKLCYQVLIAALDNCRLICTLIVPTSRHVLFPAQTQNKLCACQRVRGSWKLQKDICSQTMSVGLVGLHLDFRRLNAWFRARKFLIGPASAEQQPALCVHGCCCNHVTASIL